jgi:hypothetical protein
MKLNLLPTFVVLLFLKPAAHGQFMYTTNNGTITITGYTGTDDNMVIPNMIYGLPVTCIGTNAFQSGSVRGVTIPDSVTNIGGWAFESCTSLTGIFIPNSITGIGGGAFWGCTSLTSIVIPDSVNKIEPSIFVGCTALTNVIIPEGVTVVGVGAFWGCSSLTSITIPQSVTDFESDIGGYTFFNCTNLTSIFFRGNAPMSDDSVFRADNNATVYYLPGTTGWSTNFALRPTSLWTLPYPVILNTTFPFGVQSNQFGFTVSWATNDSVVVEASTDLTNPKWSAVTTNALSGATFYFSDPEWIKYPSLFYRVRSQ